MSGSAFAVTHHAFSSGAGRTSDGNGSHASTLKSPSYTKSVSWQHYPYIALNLEGSSQERTFSLSIAENLIAKIQSETDIPIVIVHGPKGEDKARVLVDCYNNVYRLSLSPSIKRSAAIIKDAYIAITPDTSILHMASAYNTPVVAIYADYKTRWPAMADVSESVVVGQKIDNISLDEFAKALKSVLARI